MVSCTTLLLLYADAHSSATLFLASCPRPRLAERCRTTWPTCTSDCTTTGPDKGHARACKALSTTQLMVSAPDRRGLCYADELMIAATPRCCAYLIGMVERKCAPAPLQIERGWHAHDVPFLPPEGAVPPMTSEDKGQREFLEHASTLEKQRAA